MPDDALAFELLLLVLTVVLLTWLHRDRIPFARFRAPADPQEPPLWGGGELIVSISAWILSQILALIVASSLVDGGNLGRSASFFIETAVSTGVLCAVILRLVHGYLGQPLSTLGLKRSSLFNVAPVVGLYVLFLLPLGAVAVLWTFSLHHILGVDPVVQPAVELFRTEAEEGDTAALACLVFAGVLLAPVGEELLFRGLIFGWLKARWGTWAGAFFSALLFAAVHLSLSTFGPLFVMGLVLAYVYERTGSIYFSMLFHAIFNGVTFVSILQVPKP